jgi:hypothetical protein
MTEHRDTEQIGSDGHAGQQIESEGAGQAPYTEPVLRELGALRELTFKSGEKYTAEKSSVEKSTRGG